MVDIRWATWLYAAYPQISGAAIWYLGGGFGSVADQAQKLIEPLREYSLTNYFGYYPGVGQIDPALLFPPQGSMNANSGALPIIGVSGSDRGFHQTRQ